MNPLFESFNDKGDINWILWMGNQHSFHSIGRPSIPGSPPELCVAIQAIGQERFIGYEFSLEGPDGEWTSFRSGDFEQKDTIFFPTSKMAQWVSSDDVLRVVFRIKQRQDDEKVKDLEAQREPIIESCPNN